MVDLVTAPKGDLSVGHRGKLGLVQRCIDVRRTLTRLFASAGAINGRAPWDIQVHRDRFYSRVMAHGSLGLGEAYMDGDWDCLSLDQFFDQVISAQLGEKLGLTLPLVLLRLASRLHNRQILERSKDVAFAHCDLPIEIHEATYDRRLTGSCAYWPTATTLDEAQEAKLDCRKIAFEADHTVLDIGCGWGSFIGFAAERHGSKCTGSPSPRNKSTTLASATCTFRSTSFFWTTGPTTDRKSIAWCRLACTNMSATRTTAPISSARAAKKEDGLFLLHTIWKNERYPAIDAWQDKYIFPNGDLPSLGEVTTAVLGLFVVEDVHNFGADYDKTL